LLPLDYYARVLGDLSQINHAGWAQARCPFHRDRHASLSVRLAGNGAWKCFAGCGSGDLISFHMRRTGLTFAAALRDLTRRS
jgi:DNA primase